MKFKFGTFSDLEAMLLYPSSSIDKLFFLV